MATARMQRWALTLSTYQYTIEHIKGTSNLCADCTYVQTANDYINNQEIVQRKSM